MNELVNNYHFIVPVWGKAYTKLFVDVCLPMILTPRNLGVFKYRNNANDRFVIVTTFEDCLAIKQSSGFIRLTELIRVKFILIDGLIDTSNSHAAMSACYAMAMKSDGVRPNETYFVFLTPDSFWSEGAFSRLLEFAAEKTKVVAAIGFRVNAESMSQILEENIKLSPENPTIPNNQLIKLVIENIHQLSMAHNWLSRSFLQSWPSHIYWIDREHGLIIAHCFHLHPLMVLAPPKVPKILTTIDGEFLDKIGYQPKDYRVVQNEFFGIELSPSARNWGQPLGSPSVQQVLRFALDHATSLHWCFFGKRIELISSPDQSISPELDDLVSTVVEEIKNKEDKILFRRRLKFSLPGRVIQRLIRKIVLIRRFFSLIKAALSWLKFLVNRLFGNSKIA